MSLTLRICSYNIHKGFSHLNRHMAIHEMRECLHTLSPDICLLQEVQGQHLRHERKHANWPVQPQHQFLAGEKLFAAYGANAAYDYGHHGNAVLSRFPILQTRNRDVSLYRLERRGILHCELELPNTRHIHCLSVHLSLTEQQRRRQLSMLAEYVDHHVPARAPLIIAGDFNDWRVQANDWLAHRLGMLEAFTELTGKPARSYPSALPMLRLDRVYLRGFQAVSGSVHAGKPWSQISDHAALSVQVKLK
jgi:endonuclease/exonuclease/phosphatase family metal-dependent hydrolase